MRCAMHGHRTCISSTTLTLCTGRPVQVVTSYPSVIPDALTDDSTWHAHQWPHSTQSDSFQFSSVEACWNFSQGSAMRLSPRKPHLQVALYTRSSIAVTCAVPRVALGFDQHCYCAHDGIGKPLLLGWSRVVIGDAINSHWQHFP